jgi:catechol 2,3-dioxygenase-like lactoylglutathione lyase family enzyme
VKGSVIAATLLVGFASGVLTARQKPEPAGLPAERVTGIGGVFFKARDPKALGAWYRDKLGLALQEGSAFSVFEWRDREDPTRQGATAWALFGADSKYFSPSQAALMIDYRVRNLERMLAQLRASGVTVEGKVAEDANGKFAWILDPEGNKVELWEPKDGH